MAYKAKLDNREVEITKLERIPGEGFFIESAFFVDDESELDDDQLDRLQDDYEGQLVAAGWGWGC
jgi:prephenate dehydratase